MNLLFSLGGKYSLLSGVASILTLLAGCLTLAPVAGCGKDTTFDQKMQAVEAVSKFARDNDMAAVFTFNFDGKVGLYQTTTIGVDTGSSITATLLGNAADEEPGGADAVTMKLLEAVTTKPVATPIPARPNP